MRRQRWKLWDGRRKTRARQRWWLSSAANVKLIHQRGPSDNRGWKEPQSFALTVHAAGRIQLKKSKQNDSMLVKQPQPIISIGYSNACKAFEKAYKHTLRCFQAVVKLLWLKPELYSLETHLSRHPFYWAISQPPQGVNNSRKKPPIMRKEADIVKGPNAEPPCSLCLAWWTTKRIWLLDQQQQRESMQSLSSVATTFTCLRGLERKHCSFV